MERWSGVLKIPLDASTSNFYRVAASLCLPSSNSISAVPCANAIFFHGDRVRDTGNHVIERLYDMQKVAEIIVSKFGNFVNAWVVEAPLFNGPFAIYKDFVPSVNQYGEPKSYSPNGFPASSSIVSLLSTFLEEAESLVSKEGKDVCLMNQLASSVHHCPRTIVLGFSKGGVVLNQFLSEMSSLDTNFDEQQLVVEEHTSKHEEIRIIPASKESFLNSISEVHYIDVGSTPLVHTSLITASSRESPNALHEEKTRYAFSFMELPGSGVMSSVAGFSRKKMSWFGCSKPKLQIPVENFKFLKGSILQTDFLIYKCTLR